MAKKLILILLALFLVASPPLAMAGGIYRHAEGNDQHGFGGCKGNPEGGDTTPAISTPTPSPVITISPVFLLPQPVAIATPWGFVFSYTFPFNNHWLASPITYHVQGGAQ